jgi:hypothetical protein
MICQFCGQDHDSPVEQALKTGALIMQRGRELLGPDLTVDKVVSQVGFQYALIQMRHQGAPVPEDTNEPRFLALIAIVIAAYQSVEAQAMIDQALDEVES